MKKISVLLSLIISLVLLLMSSCKQTKEDVKSDDPDIVSEETIEDSIAEITLEKLENSPSYAEASLELKSPSDSKIMNGGEAEFSFEVQNYELGAQTAGPNATKLANSGKGQHIHFILNNQPYSAHYEPNFKKEIPEGVHHLVAFLSRSYHESVKNENSVVVQKLEVGESPTDTIGLDMEAPTIIYSRPKGEYVGKDAENLLLDFFVLNTELSKEGNKVRATVNGQEFMITEWAPHVMKGLPMGEVTIQLELIDASGNMVPGPFNKVVRTVTLKE